MTVRELLLAIYRFPLDAEVSIRTEGGPVMIEKVVALRFDAPEIVAVQPMRAFRPRPDRRTR